MSPRKKQAYWNPYVVGAGIGTLIILSFVITGRGLGALGAFSTFVSSIINGIAPDHAQANPLYSSYLSENSSVLKDWVVVEIIGVCLGGLISGLLSGRFKFEVIKGPNITSRNRLILAFGGGMIMAYAAKITRGCTSGLALSGGSVLSLGAWLFMLSVFVGGYSIAFLIKKVWN